MLRWVSRGKASLLKMDLLALLGAQIVIVTGTGLVVGQSEEGSND
jgi:hypothetical protein